jgi:hypothetical protein
MEKYSSVPIQVVPLKRDEVGGGCTSSRIQLTHSLKATWF